MGVSIIELTEHYESMSAILDRKALNKCSLKGLGAFCTTQIYIKFTRYKASPKVLLAEVL